MFATARNLHDIWCTFDSVCTCMQYPRQRATPAKRVKACVDRETMTAGYRPSTAPQESPKGNKPAQRCTSLNDSNHASLTSKAEESILRVDVFRRACTSKSEIRLSRSSQAARRAWEVEGRRASTPEERLEHTHER